MNRLSWRGGKLRNCSRLFAAINILGVLSRPSLGEWYCYSVLYLLRIRNNRNLVSHKGTRKALR